MNKTELVQAIADKAELPRAHVDRVVGHFCEVVTHQLSKGDSISLIGFGTFKVAERKAREGRNPKTGKPLKIAATKAAKFAVGKALKQAVATGKVAKKAASTSTAKKGSK